MREIKTDIISTYQAVDVCYRTNQVDLIVLSLWLPENPLAYCYVSLKTLTDISSLFVEELQLTRYNWGLDL